MKTLYFILALFAPLTILTSCQSPYAMNSTKLQKTTLYVTQINGKPLPKYVKAYLNIKGDKITGYDGCNNFSAQFNSDQFIIGQRACFGEEQEILTKIINNILRNQKNSLKVYQSQNNKIKNNKVYSLEGNTLTLSLMPVSPK